MDGSEMKDRDLAKWEEFLTKMNIPFHVYDSERYDLDHGRCVPLLCLDIGASDTSDHSTMKYKRKFSTYGGSLTLSFTIDGKFETFDPIGE